MQTPRRTSIVLALAALVSTSSPIAADDGETPPFATTTHFAFFSDFDTNVNDALIVAGAARNDGASELFHSGSDEASCFAELPSSAREGWNLAVDYYARVISPASWLDRRQYLLRMDLAGLGDSPDARTQRFTEIARELDVRLPGDLWHVVLFYTTGETVRHILNEADEPGYIPYIDFHNMWDGRWGEYRDAIESSWPGYLNGECTLSEAASNLLAALATPK